MFVEESSNKYINRLKEKLLIGDTFPLKSEFCYIINKCAVVFCDDCYMGKLYLFTCIGDYVKIAI